MFHYKKTTPTLQQNKKSRLEYCKELVFGVIGGTINRLEVPVHIALGSTTIVSKCVAIGMAVAVSEQVHAASKLATHPEKFVESVVPCARMAAKAIKCTKNADYAGAKIGLLASGKALGATFSAVGGVLTVIGMIVDGYSIYSAAKKLAKDEKCKSSKKISEDIEQLENLQSDLQKLKQDLCGGSSFKNKLL